MRIIRGRASPSLRQKGCRVNTDIQKCWARGCQVDYVNATNLWVHDHSRNVCRVSPEARCTSIVDAFGIYSPDREGTLACAFEK